MEELTSSTLAVKLLSSPAPALSTKRSKVVEATALISFVDNVTDGQWAILSSPLRGDHDNSGFWKRHWLKKHNYNPVEAIFTGRKESYATNKEDRTPNILIDDKPGNIERWVNQGGIGILYQANENSLEELKNKVHDGLSRINQLNLKW